MKNTLLKISSLILCLALLCGCGGGRSGSTPEYLKNALGKPSTGDQGGEWSVFALARAQALPEDWSQGYQSALEGQLRDGNGLLSSRKNTEYSRTVLALRALGENPSDFRGYDLLQPLTDIEKTSAQGPAAIALAILALDGLETEELKAAYLERLLGYQTPDGGFAPAGARSADPDITAMALQALAHCSGLEGVGEVRSAALVALSSLQQPDGAYLNGGASNPETISQVIIALLECGLSLEDSRFVKDRGLLDALSDFLLEDGSYCHSLGGDSNLMATEQAMCALAAVHRSVEGLSALYVFSDDERPGICSLSVSCAALLDVRSAVENDLVPEDGVIFSGELEFSRGERVFDLLKRALREAGIPMEFTASPGGSAYIEGIANIYEFDFGDMSGWVYSVNGEYPQLSCALWEIAAGDRIVFEYVTEYVDLKEAAS